MRKSNQIPRGPERIWKNPKETQNAKEFGKIQNETEKL